MSRETGAIHAELEALTAELEARPIDWGNLDDTPLDLAPLDRPARTPPRPPAPPTIGAPLPPGPSVHISLRLRTETKDAFLRQSARTGVPYQTLINDALAAASASW